jgi:hypothetical protein
MKKTKIDTTHFGSIVIGGKLYDHDVIIRLNGDVETRKKKLSKDIYGTSHILSLEEAKYIHETGAETLIFGNGHSGMARLSNEAAAFYTNENCHVVILPTPQAVKAWNECEGNAIGLFHITC